jgi:hypothetical protein
MLAGETDLGGGADQERSRAAAPGTQAVAGVGDGPWEALGRR